MSNFGNSIAAFLHAPERLEEGRAWQAGLREKYGTRPTEPSVKALKAAIAREITVRQNIAVQVQDGDREGLRLSYAQLSESLYEQGRFDEALEAAKLNGNKVWIARVEAVKAALEMADEEGHCDCPNTDLNSGHSYNYANKEFHIDGQVLTEVLCRLCGRSNIRRLRPGDLTEPTPAEAQQAESFQRTHHGRRRGE